MELLRIKPPQRPTHRVPRLVLTLALAVYGLVILSHPENYRLLDSVDLAIHETGHLVFAPFGEFIGFLGGTLFQLIMPAAFVFHFVYQGDRHAASITLWWFSQNLWNISVYVQDARSQLLPLVGGGQHDWRYLLGRTDLLLHDQEIARAIHFAGVLIFGLSVFWGIAALRRAEARGGAASPRGPGEHEGFESSA